jgi:hypothetical protein
LTDSDVAALLGAADQLLDHRVGKVEQRKISWLWAPFPW